MLPASPIFASAASSVGDFGFSPDAAQSAASSISLVRMRTTRSMVVTKILPSPTLPVLAALMIASSHLVHEVVAHRDLDARLRHEVDDVLGAAVELGVAALAAEALHLRDGHAGDADLRERRADVVELEGLDDGGDEFHRGS